MALWGNTDVQTDAPIYKGVLAHPKAFGSAVRGNTAFNNTTVSAFQNVTTFGVFGVDADEVTYGATNGSRGYHSGWVAVKYGTGPVTGFTVTAPGSGFANGETVKVTLTGAVTATGTITSNLTGNAVSVSVTNAGAGFTNTTAAALSFNREKHVVSVTADPTGLGFNNADILTMSNSTVNAVATFTTNATGGFTGGSVTVTNVGLFANTKVAGDLVLTISNSTGGTATGNSTTSNFTPVLANSTGGTVTFTLGGRSGRKMCETLVAMAGQTFSGGPGSPTDTEDTVFPE